MQFWNSHNINKSPLPPRRKKNRRGLQNTVRVRKIGIHKIKCERIGQAKDRTSGQVKPTKKDMAENNREQAEKRMNSGDGGLAKHDHNMP